MASKKPLLLDGRTGEGGGQLVRIACGLSAVTSQPIRIDHVRGNRPGKRGGGLKPQHVAAIRWLADITGAKVEGLEVGSSSLEFCPLQAPTTLQGRKFEIVAKSAASSTLLVFQAILPFLLFAGSDTEEPIELEIHGGTNVSFSLSYEYFDQVLLPTLKDRFGITIERQLKERAWAAGPLKKGSIWLRLQPLPPGRTLKVQESWERPITAEDFKLRQIDVSILVPYALQGLLQRAIVSDLGELFPNVDINFLLMEDSGHDSRIYTLLVAHSQTGLRWGRDYLYDKSRKNKTPEALSVEVSRKVCHDLHDEIEIRGVVDEYLQDQLVVFQALADGRTSFPRSAAPVDLEDRAPDISDLETSLEDLKLDKKMMKDKTHKPFGDGSMHTTTARWVASELLPTAQWFNKGAIVDGAAVSFS
ncbi:EPT/RTPC-like protein [Daldinia caldariorum]|uniref:EPT/RTPC-like protein n=1 Tax=Daldinia caldariorum TaxID=326644 RepID=UPI002008DF13|nr:EPT/RTPC-like protein [Daldinia caldariorum]KAI1472480.1 EPT/RTPC-like protein [Daldinia caldariorum]